ncbi:hypothetical protein [Aliivibrio fischeri]|uniref:hypothetical protein n=1 Tax=Aliivibrio fischeri TaxID=668 RepID=UPI0007C46EC8|nr:hypothetical protein [Aliivibrio fischeri]
MKNVNKILIGLTMVSLFNQAHAIEKTYDISKFVEIDVDTGYQQRNLTNIVASYQFNNDIIFIGQAINYALNGTGYSLVSPKNLDTNTLHLLIKQLPEVHRNFSYVTLDNLLKAIVGPAYKVQYDHTNREVLIISKEYLEAKSKGEEK